MTSQPGLGGIDEACGVANAYIDTGNYERAREVLGVALSQSPNDAALLATYARAELALGNSWRAAHSAYAALAGAPNDEFAMLLYALALYELGRRHDGLLMAWRAVTYHPNRIAPLRVYAQLLQKARQLPSAFTVIDQALRLEPHDVDALIRRGSILHDMGRRPDSDAAYQAALRIDPVNATALNDLAVHRVERLKFGRALQGFLGAAGSDPDYGDLSRRNIAVVLRKLLRVVTLGAGVLSGLAAAAAALYGEGHSTAVLRVLVGLLTVALIAFLYWLRRQLPRRVLVSVLREQRFAALRIAHAVAAAAFGAWVTAIPWPAPLVDGGVLLAIGALVITRIGFWIGK